MTQLLQYREIENQSIKFWFKTEDDDEIGFFVEVYLRNPETTTLKSHFSPFCLDATIFDFHLSQKILKQYAS